MIRRHFLTYLALSTMAIAQPILDLYGRNTTVFSAAKMSPLEVSLFLVLVLLIPALGAVAVDRFSRLFGPKVNEATRLVLLACFSGLLGLAVARWAHIENNVGATTVAILLAIVLPIAFDRYSGVREWSRWLAVLSVAVTANACVQMQPVLLGSDGPTSDAIVKNKEVSVLQIVLDEFPLYSLLGPDGSINRERFPGFAQLADEATWYRNSVAESNFTHQAVPAILSSSIPSNAGGPFLSQYPKNIFTLFSNAVSVGGIEPVTSLCPHSVCGAANTSTVGFSFTRFKSFVRDASYVYGQRVAPPFIRSHIPSIEGTWGGFNAVASRFKDSFNVGALSQIEALEKGTASFVESNSQRVQVVHALVPHAPWRLTSDYRVAPLSPAISTMNPESEDGVRDTYQSFLHQVGAADTAIKNLIAQLKESGKWDSTMLVVTADHGISFLPTIPQRHTDFTDMDAVNDIYRIPTFIKYPKQTSGVVDDCSITNLD
ncbi:MAG: sulfatase-like hydrolase/transferase, partial [Actinobacteria bacterium]|nr:sulfatase-like hydrolase/transferase [Actinomycetota bacterium]